jgi:predicted metal-dependent phosphoesterase TrpH
VIDLHSHTTASDGQHIPTELLGLAAQAGVKTLAVTDHDTVAGLAEAKAEADRLGVELVPGIELSAFLDEREIHVLGHFIDPGFEELARLSQRLRVDREVRMRAMVERMQALGFPVRFEEVQAIAKDAQLGRPHLALLLVEKGYCSSTKEAFSRFLGNGRPAWVDRYRLPAAEAIELVRKAGGVATVAHPAVSRVEPHDLARLKAWGLGGVEVYHPDHPPSTRDKLLAATRELDLVPTAGSDYHGPQVTPDRHLGMTTMPPESLTALRARKGAGP